jgi:hypothetical protein
MATGMLEKCALHGLIPVSTVMGRLQTACVGEQFVNVVNRVPHDSGGFMVRAGIRYRPLTQLHFIDGNLNAQRYSDLMRVPLSKHEVMDEWHDIMHSPMSQGSVHNSRKLNMSQFFHALHTHQTCHPLIMFGMLWIDVYDSVFQFPPISSNFAQPLRSGTIFHRPQSTALHEANGHARY